MRDAADGAQEDWLIFDQLGIDPLVNHPSSRPAVNLTSSITNFISVRFWLTATLVSRKVESMPLSAVSANEKVLLSAVVYGECITSGTAE